MIGPIKKIDAIAIVGLVLVISSGCSKSSGQNVPSSPQEPTIIAKGADISWLTQMEASGIKFHNSSGSEQEVHPDSKRFGNEFNSAASLG